MTARRSLDSGLALVGVVAFCLLLSTGTSPAGDRGKCFSVVIEEPFRTPDGGMHAPGKLTMCKGMTHSPVSSLHHTYKDGYPVAMLMSKHGTAEGAPDEGRPFFMLQRDGDGLLHLSGYAVPVRGKTVTYRLDLARVKQENRLAKQAEPAVNAAGSASLILAARID